MCGYYSVFDYQRFLKRECEFNYLIMRNVNLMCEIEESGGCIDSYLYTIGHDKFDIIFNQFKNLIVSKDHSLVKNFIENKKLKIVPDDDDVVNKNRYGNYRNIYEYLFLRLSFFLEKGDFKFIVPKEIDYIRINESLKKISKPIITINGRNLGPDKNIHRNKGLYKHIDSLIKMGAFVINLTDYCNGYNFDHSSYLEIPSIGMNYSETVSYFLNSNCLISVGSCGGISNHMLTPTNLLILNDNESWIDKNRNVNYTKTSMVEARRNYSNFKTINTDYGYLDPEENNINMDILEIAINFKKPEINNFYNPSIINL